MTLTVIGAGFGRTGTMSLKVALEQLGFGPCHHMMELFNDGTGEALTRKWEQVAYGEAPDWDDVFDGYNATVDWPSSAYWRELAAHYPAAKVILTLRDADRWFDSTQATIFGERVRKRSEEDTPWARMAKKIVNLDTFGGRLDDRAHAIAVYRRHNEAVRAELPPERLLVYEAGEGWEPLCRFLGVAAPETPFPVNNTTGEFQTRSAERAAAEMRAQAPS
jgi:hypothetical protein